MLNIFVRNKILWHGDKLRAWQCKSNPFPVTMEIDPIGACNSHCPCCAGGERHGRLDAQVVDRLLYELSENGTRAVTFTGGGEPTLHPGLPGMLVTARNYGLDVALITNGLIMDEDLAKVVVSRCTWVRVSLDAGSPEDYKHSHGGTEEEYRRVIGNIRKLVDAKRELETDCTVGVGYLVDDKLIHGMESAARTCASIGVDYLQFRPFYIGWFNGPSSIDYDAYVYARSTALEHVTDKFTVLDSAPKFDKIQRGELGRNYKFCYCQQFCGVVTATGDVALCCVLRGNPKFVLGNINEDSFYHIWNSTRRVKVIKELDITKDCPPLCRGDAINELLASFGKRPTHVNFL